MILFLAIVQCAFSTFRSDHAVSLGVVAPWYEVPAFEQILFFMSDISNTYATKFVDLAIVDINNMENSTFLVEQANRILSDAAPILKACLDLGYYLPRAEAYRELARGFGGSNYSDIIAVGRDRIQYTCDFYPRDDLNQQPFDLTFGDQPGVVIYANLHNSSVLSIIKSLIQSKAQFILRPTPKSSKFGINLRGFGVEMRPFKYSMEYGVKDSSAQSVNATVKALASDSTTSLISGIPVYADPSKLDAFDVKFASFVESKKLPLLSILKDFSANPPLFLEEIRTSPNAQGAIDSLVATTRFRRSNAFLAINNRVIEMNNADAFTLIEAIKEETAMKETLSSEFGFNKKSMDTISSIKLIPDRSYLIDTRTPHTIYYNNIETDDIYSNWTTNIGELYTQSPHLRKNLVNLILFADPSTAFGLTQLRALSILLNEGVPVRVGLIPSFNIGNSLGRKVAFAFFNIAKRSQREAIEFLLDAQTNGKLTESRFILSYQKHSNFSWNDIHDLFDKENEIYFNVKSASQYASSLGIQLNNFLINGKQIPFNDGVPYLSYEIQRSYQSIAHLARGMKSLESFDIFNLLENTRLLVENVRNEVFVDQHIGTGVSKMDTNHQSNFILKLKNINWTSDTEYPVSFYIFFCREGPNYNTFIRFSTEKHRVESAFAINPEGFAYPENTLIVNGRVFKGIGCLDIELLRLLDGWSKYYVCIPSEPIVSTIRPMKDAILFIYSLMVDWRVYEWDRVSIPYEAFDAKSSLLYTSEHPGAVDATFIVNPLSKEAQRIIPLVEYLERIKLINVRMAVLPPRDLNAYLSNLGAYYRMALDSDNAIFTLLNDSTTYSAMPIMPKTWVTESMKASVDLDNILLSELSPSNHEATYILTNLIIEGSCNTSAEISLVSQRGEKVAETQSMEMNQYWQLPASPGAWIISSEGSKLADVLVSSFIPTTINIQPKESVMITKKPSNTSRIDVFVVASGKLYERLTKIMMVSVKKHTNSSVTFWILNNFLSPQYKATLPIISKKYNFSYKLVSYKWPNWLYPQTEKNRIIWGNKILFLDVLFPSDLDRVIYVDSDQIVRSDLNELMQMDFEGAPYAFTPFCESRKETEDYRFWKRGYWQETLKGKKYHISALFAVDLKRFKELHAGDWLRNFYQQLAPDPNSLSNLDQDLPNYAQNRIPIYSLPQNWLWCETWCSDETMSEAKTIDLCNNPLTKRPKLEIAQTRVKEWPGLDEEVRSLSADEDAYEKLFFPMN